MRGVRKSPNLVAATASPSSPAKPDNAAAPTAPGSAAPAAPAVPDEVQKAAEKSLGTETDVLLFGDLSKNGAQQMLAVNKIKALPPGVARGNVSHARGDFGKKWQFLEGNFALRRASGKPEGISGRNAAGASERLADAGRARSGQGLAAVFHAAASAEGRVRGAGGSALECESEALPIDGPHVSKIFWVNCRHWKRRSRKSAYERDRTTCRCRVPP